MCLGDSLLDDPRTKRQGNKQKKKANASQDVVSMKKGKPDKVKPSNNISDKHELKTKKKSKKKKSEKKKQKADTLQDVVDEKVVEPPAQKAHQVPNKISQKLDKSARTKKKTIITNYDDIDMDAWEDDDDSIFDLSEDELENRMQDVQEDNTADKKAIASKQKHLNDFSAKLGLTKDDFEKFDGKSAKGNDSVLEQVITKAGKPKRKLEVIVFEDPAKRKQKVCYQYICKTTNIFFNKLFIKVQCMWAYNSSDLFCPRDFLEQGKQTTCCTKFNILLHTRGYDEYASKIPDIAVRATKADACSAINGLQHC